MLPYHNSQGVLPTVHWTHWLRSLSAYVCFLCYVITSSSPPTFKRLSVFTAKTYFILLTNQTELNWEEVRGDDSDGKLQHIVRSNDPAQLILKIFIYIFFLTYLMGVSRNIFNEWFHTHRNKAKLLWSLLCYCTFLFCSSMKLQFISWNPKSMCKTNHL